MYKSQITCAWMNEPDGPATRWNSELESFKRTTLSYVRSKVSRDGLESVLAAPPSLEIEQLVAPKAVRRQARATDIMKNTALFVTAATPISAGATWAATALAVSTIVWPAAVVIGIGALTFATISGCRMRKSSLDMERVLEAINLRISAPEAASRIELIEQLAPLDLTGGQLVGALRQLAEQ